MSDTGWTYDPDKSEAENWADYQEMVASLEKDKAEAYAEAGTLPPGVVTRNPDTTSPEANYVSRDNIVVSGASPHHVQAAVEALGDEDVRRNALDAADVAQGVTREEYDAAILAVSPTATEEQRDEAPADAAHLDDEPEGPKATGGAQVDEGLVERVQDAQADGEQAGPEAADEQPRPGLHAERGQEAVDTDGKSQGENEPNVQTRPGESNSGTR